MILTMGLFLGTIGYTSTAVAGEPVKTEKKDCNDKDKCTKKDCCKKKTEEKSAETKTSEAKSCTPKEGQKACCSKSKKED